MSILINKEIPQITQLSFNRPEKRNALNFALMEELLVALDETHADPSQRAIIIRGNGPAFCAGLDLEEARVKETFERSTELVASMLKTIYESPLITIAAVHGAAMAGGAGLMSACDFAIADEQTVIGYPEVKRGLVPAMVTAFLIRQLQQRHLRELLLLGESISAMRALQIGLINELVPQSELLSVALSIAQKALEGAPAALKDTKKLLDDLYPSTVSHDIHTAQHYHLHARQSNEAEEGMQAFLEKRKPRWV